MVEKKIVWLVEEHLIVASGYIIHVVVNMFELLLNHIHFHRSIYKQQALSIIYCINIAKIC